MFALGRIALAVVSLSGDGKGLDKSHWKVAESNDFRVLRVVNDNPQASGEGVDCRWSVLRDGEPFAAGTFALKGLAPGQSHVYTTPKALDEARRLGGSVSLRVRFLEGERELVRRQLDLPPPRPVPYRSVAGSAVQTNETDCCRVGTARDLVYTFSKRTGLLQGLRRKGFFSDDVLMTESIGAMLLGTGERLALKTERVGKVVVRPDGVRFSAMVGATAKGRATVWLDIVWTLFRDGGLACQCRMHPENGASLPEDLGLCLSLNTEEPEISFFAADPLLGRKAAEAEELVKRREPIRGLRALEIGKGSGMVGLGAVAQPLAFAVRAEKGRTVLCLLPEKARESQRPQSVDFIIGPRRISNVVDIK